MGICLSTSTFLPTVLKCITAVAFTIAFLYKFFFKKDHDEGQAKE